MPRPVVRMEFARPDDLEAVLDAAPVAFVPLGTFEHHGWHLPVCFDGIKAHALCLRVAARTGGAVLPAFFYGTGGGHLGFKWTIMPSEATIAPLLAETLDSLAAFGFRVIVLLTGHYPGEQVQMVKRLADEAAQRHPGVRFLGLPEHEVSTPEPGDPFPGDHAAKYETSLALGLDPDWVRMDWLTPGRDPARSRAASTPTQGPIGGAFYEPADPLYAIAGKDPRVHASRELGEKLVAEIVERLAARVEASWERER